MDRERLEFSISQYVDGTLPPADVAALEAELAFDADGRALLDDFRAMDAALKREMPLPAVNWERLADHIAKAVAEEDPATTSLPIRAWWRPAIAVAAAVLIAVGAAIFWPRHGGHDQIASGPNAAPAPTN